MKKYMMQVAMAVAALFAVGTASAEVKVHLTERYASGAVFDGILTFTDGLAGLSGVAGTLSGSQYGSIGMNYTWNAYSNGGPAGIDHDNISITFEDWLIPYESASPFPIIGISWVPAASPELILHFGTPYYTGISGANFSDALMSYTSTTIAAVPEPETYAMMLGGLGLLGFMARRRQRRG